jgi:hypothetical protein
LKDFTSGGPGLRHMSVGTDIVGLSVNEVLSDDGAGSDDSVLDQGRWDEGDIVGVSAGGGSK